MLLAFVWLSAKAEVFPPAAHPRSGDGVVDAWLCAPTAAIIQLAREHPRVLRRLLSELGADAKLTNDAHLAALASNIFAVSSRSTVTSGASPRGLAHATGLTHRRPTSSRQASQDPGIDHHHALGEVLCRAAREENVYRYELAGKG